MSFDFSMLGRPYFWLGITIVLLVRACIGWYNAVRHLKEMRDVY